MVGPKTHGFSTLPSRWAETPAIWPAGNGSERSRNVSNDPAIPTFDPTVSPTEHMVGQYVDRVVSAGGRRRGALPDDQRRGQLEPGLRRLLAGGQREHQVRAAVTHLG